MSGGPPRALRLLPLLVAASAVVALTAALFVLYLRVPPRWSPFYGHAPQVAALFREKLRYPHLVLSPLAFRRAVIATLVGVWVAYGAALGCVARLQRPDERRVALWVVVGGALVAHAVLVMLPPVLSGDLYIYGIFGRMLTRYHCNPLVTPLAAVPQDPLWSFAGWRHLSAHDGPVFLLASALITTVGGGGVVGEALAFKTAAALCNLGACWTVWRLARARGEGDGLGVLALYALNPLLLVESAGSGHADAMMVALALLGLWLATRGRPTAAFALLVLSTAVKYVTGVVAVLFAVQVVFAERTAARRAVVAARLLAVGTLLAVALYAPFWRGLATFSAAADLATRGTSVHHAQASGGLERPGALAAFVLLTAVAGVLVVRLRGDRVAELSAALVTFAIMFVIPWHVPWYFAPGFALSVAGGPTTSNRALRLVTLFVGLVAMLSYGALVPVGSA